MKVPTTLLAQGIYLLGKLEFTHSFLVAKTKEKQWAVLLLSNLQREYIVGIIVERIMSCKQILLV